MLAIVALKWRDGNARTGESGVKAMSKSEAVASNVWTARNWSADAGEGSIHDDATAAKLGFRGGTVAGSIHMDQYAALLVELYGQRWFERGALSLYFLNATVDGEAVTATAQALPGSLFGPVPVSMWADKGVQVSAGTASLYDHSASALKTRDLRPANPDSLRILKPLPAGTSLGEYRVATDTALFRQRLAASLVSAPLPWYSGPSPWGGPIAPPSLVVEVLWGAPMRGLNAILHRTGGVGLFGAIEVAHHNGPFFQDQTYIVNAQVVAVSESPKTESLWFDSTAHDSNGRLVATQRMMLRFMKDSSPLYQ
jgi:acyl dehydratase